MPRRVNGLDLTPREKCFVDAYVAEPWNGTQAAIKAGYSAKGAHVTASRLLQSPKVKSAIEAARAKIEQETGITVRWVLNELALLGRARMGDYFTKDGPERRIDLTNATPEQLAAISEYTSETVYEKDATGKPQPVHRVKIKLHGKREALVDIGKHLGMFTAGNKSEVVVDDKSVDAAKEELRRRYERLAVTQPKPNGSDSSVH